MRKLLLFLLFMNPFLFGEDIKQQQCQVSTSSGTWEDCFLRSSGNSGWIHDILLCRYWPDPNLEAFRIASDVKMRIGINQATQVETAMYAPISEVAGAFSSIAWDMAGLRHRCGRIWLFNTKIRYTDGIDIDITQTTASSRNVYAMIVYSE
jgi:hypothetical protein